MKIIKKDKNFEYNDISDVTNTLDSFLENYDNLTNEEYFKILSNFYEFELEDSDYLDYINFKTGSNFSNVVSLMTDVIDDYVVSEGHGRDFSWWTVKVRLGMTVASNEAFEIENREFNIDEIKQLISKNSIYPLCCFWEKCNDTLELNVNENDINYLTGNEYGKIDINSEYFDFFMNKIRNKMVLNEILNVIRKNIIGLKLDLICDYYPYYYDELKEGNREVDKLIDCYNKKIISLQDESMMEDRLISKNPIEIVMKYLALLVDIDEKDRYGEITFSQIVATMKTINYKENKELCDKLEEVVVNINDPYLCLEMAKCVDGINLDRLSEVVIASGKIDCNYDFAFMVEKADVYKHVRVIIDSGDAEYNYKLALEQPSFVDIKEVEDVVIKSKNAMFNYMFATDIKDANIDEHARVIIESGDPEYNYMFALYVKGANVREHGNVVINSGDVYYNYRFGTDIDGSDIEKHYDVVVSDNSCDNLYKHDLVRRKIKK